LPILSVDSGLIFERTWTGSCVRRNRRWSAASYYAYIPYRDQNDLPTSTAALADLNYAQFFTENIYSSTTASSSEPADAGHRYAIIDQETGAERLRAAIGQR